MKRTLFFRVDANSTIGRGHLSRCTAVADMLKELFTVVFLILEDNKLYAETIVRDHEMHFIKTDSDVFQIVNPNDFVWLDGYQFSEDYKKRLKNKIYKLIETNDIPYEAKHVDIIFNHTPGIKKEQFGNASAELYLGLYYAMLRPSFLEYAKRTTMSEHGEGLFICFGGADTYDLGQQFVDKLLENNFDAPIYWVTHKTSTIEYSGVDNLQIVRDLSENEMINLMTSSKILLIPSSVLSFEAIALRKPFFTGYFADNQKLIFEGLKELQLAECYGHMQNAKGLTAAYDAFQKFYQNEDLQQDMSTHHFQHLKGNSKALISNIFLSA